MELLVAEETVGYGTCLEVDSTSPRYLNLVPLMHQIRTDSDFSPRCAAPRRTGSSARIPARYRQEMSLGGDRYRQIAQARSGLHVALRLSLCKSRLQQWHTPAIPGEEGDSVTIEKSGYP